MWEKCKEKQNENKFPYKLSPMGCLIRWLIPFPFKFTLKDVGRAEIIYFFNPLHGKLVFQVSNGKALKHYKLFQKIISEKDISENNNKISNYIFGPIISNAWKILSS